VTMFVKADRESREAGLDACAKSCERVLGVHREIILRELDRQTS